MKKFLIAYTWFSGHHYGNQIVELRSLPQSDGEVQKLEETLSGGIPTMIGNADDLRIISISPLQ